MKKIRNFIILSAIIAIAAYLRFNKVGESDFISMDEYVYYTGSHIGMFLRNLVFEPGFVVKNGLGEFTNLIRTLAYYVRPGYHVISAIATFIIGESKATAFYISAFFGVMTVIATFILTASLFNYRAAFFSSVFLATSAAHVLYTRMAHQISGAIFLFVISVLFYVKSRNKGSERAFMLCALFYGLSFTVHPSVIYLLPFFVILEVNRCMTLPNERKFAEVAGKFIGNIAMFFMISAFAVIFWELPRFLIYIFYMLSGKIGLFANYITSIDKLNGIISYLSELSVIFRQHSYARSDFAFLFFPSFLIISHGKIWFGLLALSMVLIVFRAARNISDFRYLLLVSWIGVVYVLYSLPFGNRELRVYIATVPALCIAQGLFLENLLNRVKLKILKISVIAIFITALCTSVSNCFGIINSQLSYREINNYLNKNKWLDKVMFNVNICGLGPYEKVCESLDGFLIAGFIIKPGDEVQASRMAVLYRNPEEFKRNPVFFVDRVWIVWPDDIQRLYREGKVKYLLTSVCDYGLFQNNPFKKEPIFSIPSPYICKIRCYDDYHGIQDIEDFFNDSYFRRIGIYDLGELFDK